MNGLVFRDIMRGPYVRGSGYIGWTQEHVEPHLETFAAQIPKVTQPALKKNTRSYTLTWTEDKTQYKALFSLEEDAFGGPCYRNGDIVLLSVQVATKVEADKKDEKAKKDDKSKDKKAAAPKASWKNVEDSQPYVGTHILPLFYYLCVQSPPTGVVFL